MLLEAREGLPCECQKMFRTHGGPSVITLKGGDLFDLLQGSLCTLSFTHKGMN